MKIEAYCEFGFILWYYLPKAYHLHINKSLNESYSRIGSKEVFYFSENHIENDIVYDPPRFDLHQAGECYNHIPPSFTKENWTPPPLNEFYKNDRFVYEKPIVTIHNKITLEWGGIGIFNYFTADALEKIIEDLKDYYTIVYIRPPVEEKYSFKHDPAQRLVEINDEEIIRRHNVIYINDLLDENKDLTYNQLQFMLLANSDKHISSAGEAVIPSYFGGETVIYTCPDCRAVDRGVWKTDSWLKELSGSKIVGYNDYEDINKHITNEWING